MYFNAYMPAAVRDRTSSPSPAATAGRLGARSPHLHPIAGRQIHRISGFDAEGTIPGFIVAHRPGSILARRMSVRDDDLLQHRLAEFLPPNLREAQKELLIARQLLNDRRRLAVEGFAVGA